MRLDGQITPFEELPPLPALYKLVGAEKEALFSFTSSGAEAVNQALFDAYLNGTRKTGKNHFIASCLEGASTLLFLDRLASMGCSYTLAPMNRLGEITAQAIQEALTPRTALVTLSWACPLTGVIHPVEEIAKVCQERGVLLHLEGSAILGRGSFSWALSGADLLSFEGALLGVPGSGGLFSKKEVAPFIVGRSPCERTLATTLERRAEELLVSREAFALEQARKRYLFEKQLREEIPEARILFEEAVRLPHISCVEFPRVHAQALHHFLQRRNIHTSHGGGAEQLLEHLLASNHPNYSALSFSLPLSMEEEQMERLLRDLYETYGSLRKTAEVL